MDLLIWTEFFVSLIFNPFWAGLLVGLFWATSVKKFKKAGDHKYYEWPTSVGEQFKGKIIRKGE